MLSGTSSHGLSTFFERVDVKRQVGRFAKRRLDCGFDHVTSSTGTRYQVPGRYQVTSSTGTRYRVPGTRYQELRYHAAGSR